MKPNKVESITAELLAQALEALLKRDERNTCQHEETHREGFIWEACDGCQCRWSDDRNPKPKWVDPPEWTEAYRILNLYRKNKK